ncbi:Uncharacterised protein [uncultured archaeon]|nr:Uncharacterised protein [uncultured archaeon]
MQKNRKSLGYLSNMLSIFLTFVMVILILYLLYFLYNNLPRSPENLDVKIGGQENFSQIITETHQFHPNMKFNHNDISYMISSDCDLTKKQRMHEAFNILSQTVNSISFHEASSISEPIDIEVSCSGSNKLAPSTGSKKDFFVAGEGGATEIVESGKYNIITNGTVLLFKYPKNSLECSYPNIELHELIHVFGFDHSQDKNSLMNPYISSCDQKLDISIINELKRLYSVENLPDLAFENIKAVKKGRYLDFNLTIKNIGLTDTGNVTLSVFDDNELVETSDVGDIKYGAGVIIKIENFKLIHLNPKQITFKIDNANNIKELDKSNNIAQVNFNN